MAPCPPPTFFKILLDASAPHLPLPPAFVARHLENKIPKNPTLRSVRGGYLWRLKIEQIGGNYCFTHGWNKVVKDAQLGYGDFLVFGLVDQSTFEVSIFGPNGCEKDLPPKIKVEEEEDDDDGVHDDGEGVVEDEDEDVVEEKDEDEYEDDEDEDEDEDDEDEDEDEDGDVDDDLDVDDDDDVDGDDDEDDDDDDDIDGDDGDPFFMRKISKTHKNLLWLSANFVELAGIDTKRAITLKNLDGKEWQMSLRSEKYAETFRYYLSSGWQDFRQSNKLAQGDVCLFKFIKGEGKLSLEKVTKKRVAARKCESPSPLVGKGKIPATEVAKRKRGRPRLEERQCVGAKSEDECAPVVETEKRKRGRPSRQKPLVMYF